MTYRRWAPALRVTPPARLFSVIPRHPSMVSDASVEGMTLAYFSDWVTVEARDAGWTRGDVDALVGRVFSLEAANLVRLARFFVDDRDAAEDLVQEAFIRLARSVHRVEDPAKVPAYLRSIVLNLARDHNRRGLVSLRHRGGPPVGPTVDELVDLKEDQQQVIEAIRSLSPGQRNCLVLRYYSELPIAEIATTLQISQNTVKTQLRRGLASLQRLLGEQGQ